MNKVIVAGIAALFFTTQALGADLAVKDAWVRATAPGQDSAAVSLHIASQKEARLVSVSSPVAESAEIHIMLHENGMMKMHPVDMLSLPANQDVELGTGNHLMLIGLKHELKEGDRVPLTLTVEYADKRLTTISLQAQVKPLHAGHDMHMHHDMHGM